MKRHITVENAPQTAAWVLNRNSSKSGRAILRNPAGTDGSGLPCLGGLTRQLHALRFGRSARIKQGRDFKRVRDEGERLVIGCLVANCGNCPPARHRAWA